MLMWGQMICRKNGSFQSLHLVDIAIGILLKLLKTFFASIYLKKRSLRKRLDPMSGEQGAARPSKTVVGSGRNQRRGYQSSQPTTASPKDNNKDFGGGPRPITDPGTAHNASKLRSYAGALMGQHVSVKTAGVTKTEAAGKGLGKLWKGVLMPPITVDAVDASCRLAVSRLFLQVCAPSFCWLSSPTAVFGAWVFQRLQSGRGFSAACYWSLSDGMFTLQLMAVLVEFWLPNAMLKLSGCSGYSVDVAVCWWLALLG
ncbi:hypothetical protein Ancab_033133 [Ancistrocladus abbreviatus]